MPGPWRCPERQQRPSVESPAAGSSGLTFEALSTPLAQGRREKPSRFRGLIAGIAVVLKAINPEIRVVGLQPEASPAAYLSLRDGFAHETYPAEATICDGLAGGFGSLPYELAAALIDEIVVVPEAAIRQAVAWLVTEEQIVAEGSGAIAIAPLLTGQVEADGLTVAAVLTGRNLDAGVLTQILEEHAAL